MADEKGYIEQIKEAVALTISDAEELAVMRLRDLAGDEVFPKVEKALYLGFDQIEKRAEAATEKFSKEDALVELVMPTVKRALKDKMNGLVAGMARKPIESIIEEAIRASAKFGVRAREQIFGGKGWADRALAGAHWLEAKLETLTGIDWDKNGEVGTVS